MKVKFVSQPFIIIYPSKTVFYKIKKSSFRPNYARYEKMLKCKIVHLKKIYKFGFNYFLEKRMVFILMKRNVVKNKKLRFSGKQCKIRKNVKS